MPICVVIGCINGPKKKVGLALQKNVVEKKSKVSLFGKPSDPSVSNIWEYNIPKEDGAVLPNRYLVCHEHFDEAQIIRDDVTIINGEEIKLPRKNWSLKVVAVPTIFKGTPVELLLKKTVRKPPTVRLPLGNITNYRTHHVKKRRTVGTRDNEVDQSVDTNSAGSLLMEKQQEEQIDIYQLEPQDKPFSANDAHHIALPSSSWHVRKPTADELMLS